MTPAPLQHQADGPGQIVEPGCAPERIATGFRFTEGPAWHAGQAALFFSDILGDAQYRWHEHEGVRVFRSPSGMANGTAWDRQYRLFMLIVLKYPEDEVDIG